MSGIPKGAVLTHTLPALCHQLQHGVKGGLVIVEDNNILTSVGQLQRDKRSAHGHILKKDDMSLSSPPS